jgi:tetratricopeptide (TPR) repeat protein
MPGPALRRETLIAALLVLLSAAVFGQTLGFGFIMIDDGPYVLRNPSIAGGLTLAGIRWALTTTYASNWHPLTWVSHMADIQAFRFAPWGHHLSSLLLHTANTVLLFLALRGMTGAAWRSALAAALFAVHPLHVESVAWVAERKDVLAGAFWMLVLLLHLRYARRPGAARYGATLAALGLGLAAKGVLVTLPCVLLLLDWWPLGRLRLGAGAARPGTTRLGLLILEKLPLLATAAAVSALTYRAQAAGGALDPFPLAARLSNALDAYASYLVKTVWPAGLAVFYPHPAGVLPLRVLIPAAALLLALTAGALARSGRQPWLAVGWLWYLGTLVPMAGFVQVGGQAMADRYTYLPLVGVFLAAAWSLAALAARRPALRPLAAGLAGAVVAALAVTGWLQTRLWADDRDLFRHAAAVTSGNWVAHNSLAARLAETGDQAGAEEQFRLALAANPSYFGAQATYAVFLFRQGRLAEAREHAEIGLRVNPLAAESFGLPRLLEMIASPARTDRSPALLLPLEERLAAANQLAAAGKDAEAVTLLESVVAADPGRAAAHNNLGILYARVGNLERAIASLRRALEARPAYPEARYNLGNALAAAGRLPEAETQFREALRLLPDSAGILNNLGAVLERQGRAAEALAAYRQALQLDPGSAAVRANVERIGAPPGGAGRPR